MLRSQWLHKEPTQVVPGCLWPESFQAVGPGPVGGLPRREFLLLGAALGPAMYHFQKVYFWGLPHRLCWKDRTAPQRVHRETINTAKEVSDCRGMGTSSNSEQPVSLMKCFSVYKGQTEEEIKSTRWERRRNIEHGSIYNTRGWQNQGSPGMKNELIWSKTKKILWRKEWLPTPVFLPGKSHGQRSLAGYWAINTFNTKKDFTQQGLDEQWLLSPHGSSSELLATALATHVAQVLPGPHHVAVTWFASAPHPLWPMSSRKEKLGPIHNPPLHDRHGPLLSAQ